MCAKWRHLGTIPCQSGQHQSRHGEIDKGLTTGVRALKIAREPTVTRDPGVGALHDPSSGQDMKAFGNDLVPVHFHALFHPDATNAGPRMIHDVEANPKVILHPVCEWLTGIAAVGPDHLETRHLSGKRLEQDLAPCSIPDISRQHFGADHQALGVHQQMPFSALNFFSHRRSHAHRHARNWF
jgi:hypothetical protein